MTNINKMIRFAQQLLGVGEEKRIVNGATVFAQDIGVALANVMSPSAEDLQEWQVLRVATKLAIDGCRSPKKFADELICLTMCMSIITGWHDDRSMIAMPTNFSEVQNMDECLAMVENMGRILRHGTIPLVESIHGLLFKPYRKSRNKKVAETFEFAGILLGMWLAQRTHLVEMEEAYKAFKENAVAQSIVLGLDGRQPLTVDELLSTLGIDSNHPNHGDYRSAAIKLTNDCRVLGWSVFWKDKVEILPLGRAWVKRLIAESSAEREGKP